MSIIKNPLWTSWWIKTQFEKTILWHKFTVIDDFHPNVWIFPVVSPRWMGLGTRHQYADIAHSKSRSLAVAAAADTKAEYFSFVGENMSSWKSSQPGVELNLDSHWNIFILMQPSKCLESWALFGEKMSSWESWQGVELHLASDCYIFILLSMLRLSLGG